MVPAAVQVSAVGSYSSEELGPASGTAMPSVPATRTLPLASTLAVCEVRAVAMDAAGLQVSVAGS
jgi:hypothetical protein